MRKVIMVSLMVFLSLLAGAAGAVTIFVKGQVDLIRIHDSSVYPSWAPPRFWYTLKGVSNAGSCTKWNGSVLIVGTDRQQLAMITSAQASGLEAAVSLDDSIVVNNLCASMYITTGNPAPLY